MILKATPMVIIFDSNNTKNVLNWRIINDAVMGGNSKGFFCLNDAGKGIFEGTVSTENNGGFSLLRHQFEKKQVSEFSKVILHVKGDGKNYQFRLKSDKNDQHSYITYFETNKEWQYIEIPLTELIPNFRGRKLNMPNYNGEQIEEIGFLVGNKKNEHFKLSIASIVINL